MVTKYPFYYKTNSLFAPMTQQIVVSESSHVDIRPCHCVCTALILAACCLVAYAGTSQILHLIGRMSREQMESVQKVRYGF